MTTKPVAESNWPAPRVAWYGVVALMFAGVIAILDRQILGLLVEPIRASLKLSDVQIGMLQGPAFTISNILLGVLIGWLVDRVHRLRLTAIGIGIWTIGTFGCGLATSFDMMFAARALIGTGEAVLAPAALSLIADYFSPTRRPVAMSVHGAYQMGGAGLALLGGGAMLVAAKGLQHLSFAGLTDMEGWRLVFIAAGIPSVAAALVLLTALEPARRSDYYGAVPGQLLTFLRVARGWIVPHLIGLSLIASVSMALISWMPTFLIRHYSWRPENIGFTVGLLFLALGPSGSIAAGFFTRWRQRRGTEDAALRSAWLGSLIVCVALASLWLPWSKTLVLVPIGVAIFGISLTPMVSAIAIQHVTPANLRGRVAALYYLITGIVAGNLGPLVPALLTQYVFRDATAVGQSLATFALFAAPVVALLIASSMKPYCRLFETPKPGAVTPAYAAT